VELANNGWSIEIRKQVKWEKSGLYKIEKDKDKVFIYNKKYSGIKVEKGSYEIAFYENKKLIFTMN